MTARAVLIVGLALFILLILRHWGEKPQMAVTPAGYVDQCGKYRPDLTEPRDGDPMFPIKKKGGTA